MVHKFKKQTAKKCSRATKKNMKKKNQDKQIYIYIYNIKIRMK